MRLLLAIMASAIALMFLSPQVALAVDPIEPLPAPAPLAQGTGYHLWGLDSDGQEVDYDITTTARANGEVTEYSTPDGKTWQLDPATNKYEDTSGSGDYYEFYELPETGEIGFTKVDSQGTATEMGTATAF